MKAWRAKLTGTPIVEIRCRKASARGRLPPRNCLLATAVNPHGFHMTTWIKNRDMNNIPGTSPIQRLYSVTCCSPWHQLCFDLSFLQWVRTALEEISVDYSNWSLMLHLSHGIATMHPYGWFGCFKSEIVRLFKFAKTENSAFQVCLIFGFIVYWNLKGRFSWC